MCVIAHQQLHVAALNISTLTGCLHEFAEMLKRGEVQIVMARAKDLWHW